MNNLFKKLDFSGRRLISLSVCYPLQFFFANLNFTCDWERNWTQEGPEKLVQMRWRVWFFRQNSRGLRLWDFSLSFKYLITLFHTKLIGGLGSTEVLRRSWSVGSNSVHHRQYPWLCRLQYHCFFPSRYHRPHWFLFCLFVRSTPLSLWFGDQEHFCGLRFLSSSKYSCLVM